MRLSGAVLFCVLFLAGLAAAQDIKEAEDVDYVDDFDWDAAAAAMDAEEDIDDEDALDLTRKASVKGKCANMGPKVNPNNQQSLQKIFGKYTLDIKKNKCPCWWNLNLKNCACCKAGNNMQCGFPMHRWCYKKTKYGCPGVCNNRFTLSTKGYPCYDGSSDAACAWCVKDGFQCSPWDKFTGVGSKDGSRCQKQTNQKYCKSVQGDCKHIPAGCPDKERCVKTGQVGKFIKTHECQCPASHPIGNGMQCYDADGNKLVSPDQFVEVEMTLNQTVETFPFTGANIETGVELQSLIESMENVDNTCATASNGCSATFESTDVEN